MTADAPRHPLALLADRNRKKRELLAAAQVGSGVGWSGVCDLRRELHELDQALDALNPAALEESALRAQAEADKRQRRTIRHLKKLLGGLERACNTLAGTRSAAVYNFMVDEGGQATLDALNHLDHARSRARAALAQARGES